MLSSLPNKALILTKLLNIQHTQNIFIYLNTLYLRKNFGKYFEFINMSISLPILILYKFYIYALPYLNCYIYIRIFFSYSLILLLIIYLLIDLPLKLKRIHLFFKNWYVDVKKNNINRIFFIINILKKKNLKKKINYFFFFFFKIIIIFFKLLKILINFIYKINYNIKNYYLNFYIHYIKKKKIISVIIQYLLIFFIINHFLNIIPISLLQLNIWNLLMNFFNFFFIFNIDVNDTYISTILIYIYKYFNMNIYYLFLLWNKTINRNSNINNYTSTNLLKNKLITLLNTEMHILKKYTFFKYFYTLYKLPNITSLNIHNQKKKILYSNMKKGNKKYQYIKSLLQTSYKKKKKK